MDLSIQNLFNVSGKVVVITGGSKGIGYMLSAGFVQNGAKVYMFSRRPDLKVAEELSARGPGQCIAMACDVQDPAAIQAVVAEIRALETNGVHVLINNAGATWGEAFDTTPKKSFDKLFGVNVTGLFQCSQAFAPLLEQTASAQDPARIINIASIDGITAPAIEEYAYAASKAAVLHLNKTMAAFLASRHITCNCISPGLFPSNMGDQVYSVLDKDSVHSMIPMGRAGRPEDIASAALFLSGKGGSYTTGANIVIDGGFISKPRM